MFTVFSCFLTISAAGSQEKGGWSYKLLSLLQTLLVARLLRNADAWLGFGGGPLGGDSVKSC